MTLVVDDSLDAQKIRRAVQLHSSAILGTQHNTSNAHKTSSSDLAKPKVNNQSNLFFSFFFFFSPLQQMVAIYLLFILKESERAEMNLGRDIT